VSRGSINLGEANLRVSVAGAETARTQINSLGGAVQALGTKLFSARAIVNSFAAALRSMIGPVALITLAYQGLISLIEKIAGGTEQATEAIKGYEDALKSLNETARQARESDLSEYAKRLLKAEREFEAGVSALMEGGLEGSNEQLYATDSRYRALVDAYRRAEAEIRAEQQRTIDSRTVAERVAARERAESARREAMDERERVLAEFEELALKLRNRIDDARDESLRLALREQLDAETELFRKRLRDIDARKAAEIQAAREAAAAREQAEREAAQRAADAFARAQAEAIERVGAAQRAEMARFFREQAVALERVVEVIERMAASLRR
jgi:hypothetical protein